MTDAQTTLIDDDMPSLPDNGGDAGTVKSNAQQVWDACVDLANREKAINRKSIGELTGLKLTIVDDHVERMIDHGRLVRKGHGILELVEVFPPPRPISKTVLPNGLVKLEVGDLCLDLTPKESRTLAQMFGPELHALQDVESGNWALARIAELAWTVREMQRQITALRSGTGDPGQLRLDGFTS
jgi:hypothetical protein